MCYEMLRTTPAPLCLGELDSRQSLRDCLYVLSPPFWRRGRRNDQTIRLHSAIMFARGKRLGLIRCQ